MKPNEVTTTPASVDRYRKTMKRCVNSLTFPVNNCRYDPDGDCNIWEFVDADDVVEGLEQLDRLISVANEARREILNNILEAQPTEFLSSKGLMF